MSFPSIFITGGAGSSLSTASVTSYGGLGTGSNGPFIGSATEALTQSAVAVAGTFSNFYTFVLNNGRTTDTVITMRKNGADGGPIVTYAGSGSQTGVKSDTSNTCTVAVDDLIGMAATTGSGVGSINNINNGIRFTPSSGNSVSCVQCDTVVGLTLSTASSTVYNLFTGTLTSAATETDMQSNIPFAGTAQYFQAYVSSNARTTDTVLTFRIGGGAGNGTVTYTGVGSQTGFKKDTTHTDAIAAGNKICVQTVLGSGTGNFVLNMISAWLVATSDGDSVSTSGASSGGTSYGAGVARYTSIGGRAGINSVEANEQMNFGTDATASHLWINVLTNGSTANVLVKFRKNGADGNQIVTVSPAGATGRFEDTTHTDSFLASDNLAVQVSGVTTAAFKIQSLALKLATSGTPGLPFRLLFINQSITRASVY